ARRRAPHPPPPDGVDLTVLTANVLKGRADTADLAALIARERPDVVVLPEAGHDFRDKLDPLVAHLGYRSEVSTRVGARDVHSVTVLVADTLGDTRVRAVRRMRLPHLEVTGGRLGGRTLHAVHLTAPLLRRQVANWRRDIEVLAQMCAADPAPVVAGDFNSTFDHAGLRAALGGCRSAADGTGLGLVGTYPSRLPRWFGIQIDHVLVPSGTSTRRLAVLDVAGTDHRAVLAQVTLGRTGVPRLRPRNSRTTPMD
ncbi:MAG TPA: endonuclease/exonuclease/phosphatase family protein, partial [Pseudonocardia sp.]|nr:endonuclease/exonuclease/phosphatase family protein [Pseudonocardia sp.]